MITLKTKHSGIIIRQQLVKSKIEIKFYTDNETYYIIRDSSEECNTEWISNKWNIDDDSKIC